MKERGEIGGTGQKIRRLERSVPSLSANLTMLYAELEMPIREFSFLLLHLCGDWRNPQEILAADSSVRPSII